MPPSYVETLFDQYAPRFDAALTAGLAYRGPALLRAAVEAACARAAIVPRFADVLDLGCGTGLAGVAFRDVAGRLTGVDLSANMLAAARAKGLYDDLVQGEITAFLAREVAPDRAGARGRYDLVMAADVFAYMADLAPVAAAIARVTVAGGLFAFTAETHAGGGVMLGEKLRYAHGAAHVRDALAAAGLDLLDLRDAATRTEAGVAVPGLVVVARATR
jgi:predicted TPR repeat methyltransferase